MKNINPSADPAMQVSNVRVQLNAVQLSAINKILSTVSYETGLQQVCRTLLAKGLKAKGRGLVVQASTAPMTRTRFYLREDSLKEVYSALSEASTGASLQGFCRYLIDLALSIEGKNDDNDF